jgi:aspartate kinase
MENISVVGITLDKNQARVSLREVSDKPGIAAEIFQKLANKDINVDMIIQNASHNKKTNLGFTVPEDQLDMAKADIESIFFASGSILGSVVKIPSTSLYISQISAFKVPAKATAERSLPPRPKVVISPFLLTP